MPRMCPNGNNNASETPGVAPSLAAFVRGERRRNRLSQGRLALLAGVGRRFVVELEAGKPTLRLDKVEAVLRVFGRRLAIVRAGQEPPDA